MPRPPSPEKRVHRSFRVREHLWEAAKVRAAAEGTMVTVAVAELIEGYAEGHYDLPKKKVVREYPTKD